MRSPKNQAPVRPEATSAGDARRSRATCEFYGQPIDWTVCGEFQCATARCRSTTRTPRGPSIGIALARAGPRGGDPIGSLLLNPGGPGASGVDFVEPGRGHGHEDVARRFDLVGFDPRGVQRSSPVTCVDAAAQDALIARDFDY